MKTINLKNVLVLILSLIILLSITTASAYEDNAPLENNSINIVNLNEDSSVIKDSSSNLEMQIKNADNGDEILIEPGTYYLHNILITKNITLQGNGSPDKIIIDGENKSSIFLIRSDSVYVTFKNLTFINGFTNNFGGAISMETGHAYVDYCNFINNTALNNTNAGAISNYGNESHKGYLFVNNSLFINNHADHDGGAVTTCFANSDIYNSVFIKNSAHRDGGAIRVSVQGYGHVEDCIFMYNHADEWGGAYYSWSGTSKINRCIFLNNTAGTNGGAIMVSGDLTLENSIIANNTGIKRGGSFYIQEPMYQAKTNINVHNNLITNNSSPIGQEIFVRWRHAQNLYPDFNDNDWGDENPNYYKVNDPYNVTKRIKVRSTTKSNLENELNMNLLNRYTNLINKYFPENYLDNIKKQATITPEPNPNIPTNTTNNQNNQTDNKPANTTNIPTNTTNNQNNQTDNNPTNTTNIPTNTTNNQNNQTDNKPANTTNTITPDNIYNENTTKINTNSTQIENMTNIQSNNEQYVNSTTETSTDNILNENTTKINTNSTQIGDSIDALINNEQNAPSTTDVGKQDKKAYELNEAKKSVAKKSSPNLIYVALSLIVIFAALIIGYKKEKRDK